MTPHPHCWIAPAGTIDCAPPHHGRHHRKPWHYDITAVVPHLDTIEPLRACVALLRAQSLRPYIMIVDTGSPPAVCRELEKMRSADLEIHYVAGHGYRHTSEAVAVALDLAHSRCQTKLLFHTHADCFLRRKDFLENMARITNANTPAIGYRMSPRGWVTNEWEWMVGHVCTLLYMPSIHRAGATWSMQRTHYAYGYPWEVGHGWPDTETGFNRGLRDAGIVPVFIGHDRNYERQTDDNIDHVRSHTGAMLYAADHYRKTSEWMAAAMREAWERVECWNK